MRHTDLELYRWEFHNSVFIHTTKEWRPDHPSMLNVRSWPQYWKEYGAFISMLPRQTGKSTMITTLAHHLVEKGEDYFIFTSFNAATSIFIQSGFHRGKIKSGRGIRKGDLGGYPHSTINIFIDEFQYIDMKNHLVHILNHPWKSVTMVSSLR